MADPSQDNGNPDGRALLRNGFAAMRRPTGELTWVPRDRLAEAVGPDFNYSPMNSDQVAAHERAKELDEQGIRAFALGALDSFVMNQGSTLAGLYAPQAAQDFKELKSAHPITSTVAEVAGLGGSFAFGPGAALAKGAARVGTRLAARAIGGATGSVAQGAVKLAGQASFGAASGGLASAGHTASQIASSESDIGSWEAAKEIAAAGVEGAALGAVLDLGMSGVASGYRAARSAAGKAINKATPSGRAFDRLANRQAVGQNADHIVQREAAIAESIDVKEAAKGLEKAIRQSGPGADPALVRQLNQLRMRQDAARRVIKEIDKGLIGAGLAAGRPGAAKIKPEVDRLMGADALVKRAKIPADALHADLGPAVDPSKVRHYYGDIRPSPGSPGQVGGYFKHLDDDAMDDLVVEYYKRHKELKVANKAARRSNEAQLEQGVEIPDSLNRVFANMEVEQNIARRRLDLAKREKMYRAVPKYAAQGRAAMQAGVARTSKQEIRAARAYAQREAFENADTVAMAAVRGDADTVAAMGQAQARAAQRGMGRTAMGQADTIAAAAPAPVTPPASPAALDPVALRAAGEAQRGHALQEIIGSQMVMGMIGWHLGDGAGALAGVVGSRLARTMGPAIARALAGTRTVREASLRAARRTITAVAPVQMTSDRVERLQAELAAESPEETRALSNAGYLSAGMAATDADQLSRLQETRKQLISDAMPQDPGDPVERERFRKIYNAVSDPTQISSAIASGKVSEEQMLVIRKLHPGLAAILESMARRRLDDPDELARMTPRRRLSLGVVSGDGPAQSRQMAAARKIAFQPSGTAGGRRRSARAVKVGRPRTTIGSAAAELG